MTAFDQQLWYTFRKNSIKAHYIDSLFSLPANLLQSFNVRLFNVAPIPWTLATICWLIPLAAIFPPGALEVVGDLTDIEAIANVPTLDVQMDTTSIIPEFTGTGDCYYTAAQPLRRSTARTILDHEIISFIPPCQSNCSYPLTFNGPSFECHNATFDQDNMDNATRTSAMFINAVVNDHVFWLYFTPNTVPAMRFSGSGITQAVACRVYASEYRVNITFENGKLKYDGVVERKTLLDWDFLTESCGFRIPRPWNITNMAAPSCFY